MTEFHGSPVRSSFLIAPRRISLSFRFHFLDILVIIRDRSAITSLEFALIGLPFFALILATFSLGIWYYYATSVDLAVYAAARQFMTGQIQSSASAITPAAFTTILCGNGSTISGLMPAFVPCTATNPVVNISIVQDFNTLVTTVSKTNKTTNPPSSYEALTLTHLPTKLCSPQPLDIVYIQAIYQIPILPAVFSVFGGTLLSGTTIQVEEFPTVSGQVTNC
jgi:Flp pilus assembly protein TadG